jgi:hypothetical protein
MVEMVGIHQVMWFVMLESTKDRVIGVDTPGQQVLPRVWYGMACLLIRDVVGSASSLDEWKFGVVTRLGSCHNPVLKSTEPKPPYVCPGCSNHTHGNNMINR